MKKSQLIAMSVMSLFAGSAMAQSAFSGFYGQLSTGYENNQLGSLSGTSTNTPNASTDTDKSAPSQNFGGAPLVLGAGYYWQASEKWLFGFGADYSALTQTSSNITITSTNTRGNTSIPAGQSATTNGANLQLSNRFNLFLSPAYAIDKDKLVYLKAGYSQVGVQYNRQTSATTVLNGVSTTTAATGGSQSSTLNGYIVGLGYKQIITRGLYGFVEANYMGYNAPNHSYNSTTRVFETLNGIRTSGTRVITANFASLNTFQALVGLGYAF
jgi:outer membrane immunogenic protein